MEGKRYGFRDFVAEHPGFDHVAALGGVVLWFIAFRRVEVANVAEFFVGLATVSALVLTSATFVCTLTYQSTSARISDIRIAYGVELRRNWVSIFSMTFLTSVGPLVALLFIGSGFVVPAVGVWCLAMLAAKAARTIYWLNYTLFTQYVDDRRPRALVVADHNLSRKSA